MKLKQRAVDWFKECAEPSKKLDVDKYALGQKMRAFRESYDVSLRRVADALNFTPPYFSDCERGFRQLSEDKLQAFIDACQSQEAK